jgi:thiol-disulfide isomerase/thioredoxin
MARRVEQKAAARERIAAQLAAQQQAERRRRLLLAVGAVVLVVVIVGGLVTIRLVGGGKKTATGPSGAADAGLVTALSSIPDSTFAAVGISEVKAAPSAITAPALTADGKPKVLYIGAEFCPYCAAERWPVTVALSRFGTFSNLGTTHSASEDVFPNTPTLSFHGATYTSQYLAFTGVETTTNEMVGNGYKPLDTPTAEDQKTFDTYNKPPYVDSDGSIPFIDLGGKYVGSGATYSPDLLAGKTPTEIADALKDPSSPIAKAVDGSANVYTAAICKLTNNQPAKVCSTDAVTAAAAKLGAAKG